MANKSDRVLEQTRAAADHFQAGRYDQALAAARRILQKVPNQPQACQIAAMVLGRQKQLDQALYLIERAVANAPDDGAIHTSHAVILLGLGRLDDAIASFRKAVQLQPELPSALVGLATALQQARKYDEAIQLFERVRDLDPDVREAHFNLANAQLDLARADEAVETLRNAAKRFPEDPILWTMLCNAINYPSGVSASEIFGVHNRYGAIIEKGWRSKQIDFPNSPQPDRPIRVGYLSPDMRRHSVAYFLHSILKAHNPEQVLSICYSLSRHTDDMTDALRQCASEWRDCSLLNDAELEQRIKKDRVDILVELCGHFANHRLVMLAHRVAPIQVTYLGYPQTTGLRNIQYRLVDAFTDPPDEPANASEELWRLPECFICYTPPDDAPEPAPPPCVENGSITFGSFNEAKKISHEIVELWARVLDAVPGSRLLLKAASFEDPSVRNQLAQRFAAHGVKDDRLEIVGRIPKRADHLAFYSRVDIALDTFPYHGTTTTCEAMWMGVPTITLKGDRHAARVGCSLLHTVGLDDLIALDHDSYVNIASRLAAEPARLVELRKTFRQRMRASCLCDPDRFTRALEQAYRAMWVRWCENPR